jgi:hypothetical protein
MTRFGTLVLGGAVMLAGASSVNATTILYNDFSDLSGMTLNGSAASLNPNSDNHLRLTNYLSQGSSAFSTNAIALNSNVSFSTAFSFNISNPVGIGDSDGQGADGLTFTLQTNSNTAGGIGGGIGYAGIANSLGIEFDTYNNGSIDNYNGNHVGIDLNGSMNSVAFAAVTPRLNNGQDWFAWVDYNGLTDLLEVRLNTTNLRPTAALLSYAVDLTSVLGSTSAYAGFTSGTGAGGNQHDILNWQFNSDYKPISQVGQDGTVPEPAPLALMLAGVTALLFRKKQS